jgi:hypothetical protein
MYCCILGTGISKKSTKKLSCLDDESSHHLPAWATGPNLLHIDAFFLEDLF